MIIDNNDSPLVTIAIPAYKRKFLKQSIDSALAQTYSNIEVIIVNDASPENLDEIVLSYNDKRIRYYVNEKNIGGRDPVENWNKCLSYANGDYFSLLCDDDIYEDYFIEEMICLAEQYPNTIVFRSRVKIINEKSEIVDLFPSAPSYESAMDYLWAKVSRNRVQTISEFMLRTKDIKDCGGYVHMPKAWCSDDMSILTFARRGGIAHSNKLGVSFRMSSVNISSHHDRDAIDKIKAQMLFSNWINEYIKEEPTWFQSSISLHRKYSLSACLSEYLQFASMKDILFLLLNRKDYNIPFYLYMKSFLIRISRFVKR